VHDGRRVLSNLHACCSEMSCWCCVAMGWRHRRVAERGVDEVARQYGTGIGRLYGIKEACNRGSTGSGDDGDDRGTMLSRDGNRG